MSTSNLRRNYYIDKSFQTEFILKFCLITVASSSLIGGILFYLMKESTIVTIENTKVLVKSTADVLLPLLIPVIVLVAISAAFTVAVMTMYTSHRIAGPAYRLARQMEEMREGMLNIKSNIRSTDQLQELAHNVKELSSVLTEKHRFIKSKLQALDDYLSKRDYQVSIDDAVHIQELMRDVASALTFFKTE